MGGGGGGVDDVLRLPRIARQCDPFSPQLAASIAPVSPDSVNPRTHPEEV